MKRIGLFSVGIVLSLLCSTLRAQVPQLINYQGRVVVGSTNFDGSGQFKFALVNAAGTTAFWTSDGTHLDGTEPSSAVTLTVTKGLYSVLLGETSLTNMTALPASVFNNSDVRLRVWFNDGTHGSQQLTPDQRIASVGYAVMAGNVPDAAITSAKIASGAIGSPQLASGAVTGTNIAQGAIGSPQLAPNLTLAGTTTGSFSGNGAGLTNVSARFPWQVVAGTSQQTQPNTGYLLTNSAQVIVTLPSSPNPGDVVRLSSIGVGGWRIAQNAGQSVNFPSNFRGIWTPRESNRNWSAVASSADGSKLVAVVYNGGQIYTSTDSGVTWTPRDSNRNWQSVASSADGSKLVAVVQNGQIYTSTDSGVTWTARESSRFWYSVGSSSDGSKLVAVVDGGQIYTSTDSGVTWTARESTRNWVSVASSADGSKLVAMDFNGPIYTSTDSGVTWTPRESNRPWFSVASSADGSKLVAAVLNGQIYTSTDSGVTWTPRVNNQNWFSVASSADGSKLVAVVQNGGQIYTSTDSGVTWTPRESNRSWQSVASSADGSKLVAVVTNGQIYTSSGTSASGTAGYLLGDPNSAVELQYIGNGQFVPLSHEGTIIPF